MLGNPRVQGIGFCGVLLTGVEDLGVGEPKAFL